MAKRALITGITGQDGSYLSEYLLELGYEVHGLVRRVAAEEPTQRLARIAHLRDRLHLHSGSLESYPSIFQVFAKRQFDECYHLGAQSFVTESFVDGFSTMQVNVTGTHYMLAAIRELQPSCRFYFAGSSEMFGAAAQSPQSETTPFHPRSPYGISKVSGFHLTRHYRETYEVFGCSGILFNHESPRRGVEFVTRKISSAVARIKKGEQKELLLGNLDVERDWGHARDYVKGMHRMLQQPEPGDFVLATGTKHSVRDFCERAFAEVELDYRDFCKRDQRYYRPSDIESLVGDPAKAHKQLGWTASCRFPDLVREMVQNDVALLSS